MRELETFMKGSIIAISLTAVTGGGFDQQNIENAATRGKDISSVVYVLQRSNNFQTLPHIDSL